MKAKLVKKNLNEEIQDYYPKMTQISKEIVNELENEISSLNLKKDEEYNLYVRIGQWVANKEKEVDGSYWTSGQPG
jgi:hypothetical protein